MSTLTCPKCQSDMRSYERNRVLVDQCTSCGGIFLDRGELEQLAAAEQRWHDSPAPQPAAPPQQQGGYQQGGYQQGGYGHGGYGHGGYGKPYRRKKSFLSELFDD